MAETGCDGVMSSEGLLENPALFSGKQVPMDTLVKRYLYCAAKYPEDQIVKMAKKHCFQFLYASLQVASDGNAMRGKLGSAKTIAEMEVVADEIAGRRAAENIPERGWYRRHWKSEKPTEVAAATDETTAKADAGTADATVPDANDQS
jgi:tRNA-dihydrouridine synthase 1